VRAENSPVRTAASVAAALSLKVDQ
jgi:hypothetical protein